MWKAGKRLLCKAIFELQWNADIDEMMLMKNCKHIIAANSTFSWWASWLNEHEDALHICPARRYGNLHMIPENWIKIAVE